MERDTAPRLRGVLETAIYVADLGRSTTWYRDLFGFEVLIEDDRMCAFDVGGRDVLLLFLKGGTLESVDTPGGRIPPHDAEGRIHFAFAADVADIPVWERRLARAGVEVESRVEWKATAKSLYFRDPDGHLVELATPGLWANY
ncbi:MAG: VOC family protein [Gemmatimonadales bacterium]|nr:VOC family protein [Gemmatimonadales bacterium]